MQFIITDALTQRPGRCYNKNMAKFKTGDSVILKEKYFYDLFLSEAFKHKDFVWLTGPGTIIKSLGFFENRQDNTYLVSFINLKNNNGVFCLNEKELKKM